MTSEQDHRWNAMRTAVRAVTDAVGTGIDSGIVDTVVVLNLLGFPTDGSCEGHLHHGHPSPWVTFDVGGRIPEVEAELARLFARRDALKDADADFYGDEAQAVLAKIEHLDQQAIAPQAVEQKARQMEQLTDLVRQYEREYDDRTCICVTTGSSTSSFYRLEFETARSARTLPLRAKKEYLVDTQALFAGFTRFLTAHWLEQPVLEPVERQA